LRDGYRVTTNRKRGNFVGALCIAAQVAAFCLEWRPWPPGTPVWWFVDEIATLVAVAGSVYAAAKASRWWYVMTTIEALLAIIFVLGSGG